MVKMRINKEAAPICTGCGAGRSNAITQFDLSIGEKEVMILCDKCAHTLLTKLIKAGKRVDDSV